MKIVDSLIAEPWRHDLLATLRRIERSFPESQRIAIVRAAQDCVTLGQIRISRSLHRPLPLWIAIKQGAYAC